MVYLCFRRISEDIKSQLTLDSLLVLVIIWDGELSYLPNTLMPSVLH